jgi:hypothetical protein
MGRLKALALQWAADLCKNEFVKTAAVAARAEYLEEQKKAADDVFHVTPAAGWTLTHEEASYLTVVTDSISISFICRKVDCGFYGMNSTDTWIKHLTTYHFRCPLCGCQYKPWSLEKAVPVNKMMVLQDPHTKQVSRIPCIWPGTSEDNWLAVQAELYARNLQTPQDLDDFLAKKSVELTQLLGRVARPEHMQHFPTIPEGALHVIQTAAGYPPETYQKQKNEGFWGNKYTYDKSVEPFNEWPELIALLGSILAATRPSKL